MTYSNTTNTKLSSQERAIVQYLKEHSDEKYPASDLWVKLPELSNDPDMSGLLLQKLLKSLVSRGEVARVEIDRRAYFSVPAGQSEKEAQKNLEKERELRNQLVEAKKERSTLDNIIKDVDTSVEKDMRKRHAQNKRKRKLYTFLVAVVVCFIAFLVVNECNKNAAIKKLSANLVGQTFEDMNYWNDLDLYDKNDNDNYVDYNFEGAVSTFIFNEDGTVKWTRRYYRDHWGKVLTSPVTTVETYEVVYMGSFVFSREYPQLYLKLESGDVLEFRYDLEDPTSKSELRPNSVNYCSRHDKNLNAPEELKYIETSYVSDKSYSSTSSSSGKTKCIICNGTGSVKYYTGDSDLEAILDGYDPYTFGPCTSCGGDGWD